MCRGTFRYRRGTWLTWGPCVVLWNNGCTAADGLKSDARISVYSGGHDRSLRALCPRGASFGAFRGPPR